MTKVVSRKLCVVCGTLLAINTIIAMAYLLVSAPHLMLAPWLLSGSGGVGSLLGFA